MRRQSIMSSNISSIGYDVFNKTLEVEFNTGQIYEYYNVPEKEFIALINASSAGNYFASYIKNTYSFKKIT